MVTDPPLISPLRTTGAPGSSCECGVPLWVQDPFWMMCSTESSSTSSNFPPFGTSTTLVRKSLPAMCTVGMPPSVPLLLCVTGNPMQKQSHECCHTLRRRGLQATIGPNERTDDMHQQRPDEQLDGGIKIDRRDDSLR